MEDCLAVDTCLCCGPSAVQHTRLNTYWKHYHENPPAAPDNAVWVVCGNPACGRKPQSFACAMWYCDRVHLGGVPAKDQAGNAWLRTMMPYYHGQRTLEGDIGHVENCISCALSAEIPSHVRPSLRKPSCPTPVTGHKGAGRLDTAEGIVSDNLNEHAVESIASAMQEVALDGSADPSDPSHNPEYDSDAEDSDWDGGSTTSYDSDGGAEGEIGVYEDDANVDDNCATYIRSKRKRAIEDSRRQLNNLPPSSHDNMAYLRGYRTIHLVPPNIPNLVRNRTKRMRKGGNEGRVEGGHFVGALYIPSHRLIICNYADNAHLYVDIHGFAKSLEDKTPHIPHMVLNEDDARALEEYYELSSCNIPYLPSSAFTRELVEDVEMPEDPSITRSWRMHVATVSQKVPLAEVQLQNGRTSADVEELAECQVLSWRRLQKKADQVAILGDLSLERGRASKRAKLLAVRVQNLVRPSMSTTDVLSMYTNLRPASGRNGFEMTRTSGTAGYTCPQSDKNLLYVLKEDDGALPNKAGACLIIRGEKFYWVVYSKHGPDDDDHPVAITTYPPPQPGGSLMVNGNAIDAWPILGEFAYVKMIVALTLKKLNVMRGSRGLPVVATGPIKHELQNICYARGVFRMTKSYRSFCIAFMSVNSMSLIAWPVGQHNDHFHEGGESLENKITFVLPREPGLGRGGSLFGENFVFALLDWRYEARCARGFYVAHAHDMGIGPPAPRGAQRLLTEYFQTADDGPQWEAQYRAYMRTARRNRRARGGRGRGRRSRTIARNY